MASLTRWTWVWASSGSWWWTGKPRVLESLGSQGVRHDWATELNLYVEHFFKIAKLTVTQSRRVVSKGSKGSAVGSYYLSSYEFQFYKMKRVLEMDGNEDCTTQWYLMSMNCVLQNGHNKFYVMYLLLQHKRNLKNKQNKLHYLLFMYFTVCVNHSVVSDPLWLHGLQPPRLLCAWNCPGKNTGVGCHSLLQGIFSSHGSKPGLLHCGQILYCLSPQGSPCISLLEENKNQRQTVDIGYCHHCYYYCISQPKLRHCGGLGLNTEHSPGNITHFYGIPSVCFSRHSQMNHNNHEHRNCFHQQPVTQVFPFSVLPAGWPWIPAYLPVRCAARVGCSKPVLNTLPFAWSTNNHRVSSEAFGDHGWGQSLSLVTY